MIKQIRNKKGELPGWNFIVMMILGLVGLILLIFIVYKAKGSSFESINILSNLFGG